MLINLSQIVDQLEENNYKMVSLKKALKDNVYDQKDFYYKKWGISWMYRWIPTSNERKVYFNREPSLETIEKLFNQNKNRNEQSISLKTYYFIQYKRFCRIALEKRMHPIFLALIMALLFVFSSELFFSKFQNTPSLYLILAVALIILSASENRLEFLKQCFTQKDFRRIRWVENGVLSLPFSIFFLNKEHFLFAVLIIGISLVLPFVPVNRKSNFTFPTPFSRYPFEFTRGFRQFVVLHALTYGFTFVAISFHNFNMGILVVLISFLLTATYFSFHENRMEVWIFHHTPKQFLIQKIKTILRYGLLTSFPILVALLVFFPTNFIWTILAIFIGFLYIFLFLVMKYAFLPDKPTFADELIQLLCVFFPPAMLAVIPYYSSRSIKNLRKILHD